MIAAEVIQPSTDAEIALLGAILLDNRTLDDAAELVRVEDFAAVQHQHIYAAMQALAQGGSAIDTITLADELRRAGTFDRAGGIAKIATLDAFVPATANVVQYARVVRERALERRLGAAGSAIVRLVGAKGTAESKVDEAERLVFEVAQERVQASTSELLGPTLVRVFDRLQAQHENPNEVTGTPTGFTALDRRTAGFHGGQLVIIAARPSMGKTAFALNIAMHVAKLKRPVIFFSLEMPKESLATRLLASEARVDSHRVRTGRLLDADFAKLGRAADQIHRAPLVLDDASSPSVLDIRARCRRVKAKIGDLGLVVVDYLQLVRGADVDNREQQVAQISRGLKSLARELDVPVVALSQLNRLVEARADKRPLMSDLRESGAIEQDADVICALYRDEVYKKNTEDKGIAEVIILKQRNGPIGTVRTAFLRDYTRFENLANERDEDV